MQKNAMILAAGLGTRLKPITNEIPKALVPVNGKPMIRRVIEHMLHHGFSKIIVNVHYFSGKVIEYLAENNNFGAEIVVSDETDLLLETGGGIKKAASLFDDDSHVLVHNVDILSDLDLDAFYNHHINNGGVATLAVKTREASRVFLFDKDQQLCGWRNNKTGEVITTRQTGNLYPIAFTGIHVFHPQIFSLIEEKGAFSITPVYLRLAEKHKITGYQQNNMRWADIGTPENLREAEKLFN
jgi:N-acetyl-alpha-D-muramate 1-phosphate uridylyltransferase